MVRISHRNLRRMITTEVRRASAGMTEAAGDSSDVRMILISVQRALDDAMNEIDSEDTEVYEVLDEMNQMLKTAKDIVRQRQRKN